jgi:glutaredoxin
MIGFVARRVGLVVIAVSLALGSGCSCNKRDDGTAPLDEDAKLRPLSLRDDTPDVLLTWIDAKGDTHTDMTPHDVPEVGKSMVRVVAGDRTEGLGAVFYIADLTRKNVDGTYPVQSMPRRAFEAEIARRRAEATQPNDRRDDPRPTDPPRDNDPRDEPKRPDGHKNDLPPVAEGAAVIIYGASWCGPCHLAEAYLKRRHVKYVMKDIEQTPGAADEMRQKLARAGRRGGSIPVIDVRGTLLVGFSEESLEEALQHGGGTAL